eukprot:11315530-Alexandrium_andersonii.AAC.1
MTGPPTSRTSRARGSAAPSGTWWPPAGSPARAPPPLRGQRAPGGSLARLRFAAPGGGPQLGARVGD